MFKLQDCFLLSGVFNETLLKRFRENYNPEKGSRLWMIPGHVIYTTPDHKVFTCDARPLDLLSPSEPCTGELIAPVSPVLDIFFESESLAPRMYVALSNGDVQIFEYRALLYEWARVGYFNVNIVSPNSSSSNDLNLISSILISPGQSAIYWSEVTNTTGCMKLNLYKRTLPAYGVREITQSTLGPLQVLLKNCPKFDIVDVHDNICIIPELPNSVNLYLMLSLRCYLWVFDISGKCLWRGVINDEPLDFISLCIKCVGLWSQKGNIKICKLLYNNKKILNILHDDELLTITSNGELEKRTKMPFKVELACQYYVLWNILCIFNKDALKIYSTLNGELLQVFEFQNDINIYGVWFHNSSLPCFGFYTDLTVLMLQPQSLQTIFNSKTPSYLKILHLLSQENIHCFGLMKDVFNYKKEEIYLEPLKKLPNAFQSKALLLVLYQLCREKGIETSTFPFNSKDVQILLSPCDKITVDTRLKELLEPLVDCYCKLENARNKI